MNYSQTTQYTSKDIFSLFQSKEELYEAHQVITERLFTPAKNQQLFSKYVSSLEHPFDLNIFNALTYHEHIIQYYFTHRIEDFTSSSQDVVNLAINYFRSHSFEIISCYYTLDYLLNKNKSFLYSDLLEQDSYNISLFEISYTDGEQTYYKLKKDSRSSRNRSNDTRELRSIKENLFYPLINYMHGDTNHKNPNMYFIIDFLSDVSVKIASQTNSLNCANFVINENSSASTLRFQINRLLNIYTDCVNSIFKSPNYWHKILAIYKLEYSFGILSLNSFIKEQIPTNILYESAKKHELNCHESFWTCLNNVQLHPNVFDPLRYGLTNVSPNVLADNPPQNIIDYSRIFLVILLNLYNGNLIRLHEDLGDLIGIYLHSSTTDTPYICDVVHRSQFPDNSWYLLRFLYYDLLNPENMYCQLDLSYIQKFLNALSDEGIKEFSEYLKKRYSNTWFKQVEDLFDYNQIRFEQILTSDT